MAQTTSADGKRREKAVAEEKLKRVHDLEEMMAASRTVLIASMRKLPGSQFHAIKKQLRGKADIQVEKKSLIMRAIDASTAQEKGIESLKDSIQADVALFFSDMEPFDLAALLADNQSPAKAKAGDIAPEDIHVEPGPTDLVPGPAISELSGVGLKVAVEGGKLAIKQPATIVKAGETIKENVASVMSKLNIMPLRVGFEPLAAYDAIERKVYRGIRIDKKGVLAALRDALVRSNSFAVSIAYPSPETLQYLLAQAAAHEKAIQALVDKGAPASSDASTGGRA